MNIVFICPLFHGYYKKIIEVLERHENKVSYYPTDNLKLSIFNRIIGKFSKRIFFNRYDEYINNIIASESRKKVDKVVLIFGGLYFRKNHFFLLKAAFKDAEFIFYNWDSMDNGTSNALEFYNLFDKYYSFDIDDCNKYGYQLLSTWYSYVNPINNDTKYDFGSLMTFGPKKVKSYVKVKKALSNDLVGKEYLIMPNKGSYLYNRIKYHKQFKFIDKKNIYHKWLPLEEATSFYNDCKAVIDIPLDGQNGLTTRTFEVLKQEKKLITTNKAIKQYEFYTPNNIFVVDENTKIIPKEFFETPFDKNYCISEKYSLESFVKTLFDLDNE